MVETSLSTFYTLSVVKKGISAWDTGGLHVNESLNLNVFLVKGEENWGKIMGCAWGTLKTFSYIYLYMLIE